MLPKYASPMLGILLLIIVFGIATGAAIYLHSILIEVVANDYLRKLVTGLCFLGICIGLPWLLASLAFGEMYPTITHVINEEYSYTQQPFGFVTTSSQGYDLVLYQHRTFWIDKEIGKVRLECAGNEDISTNVVVGHKNINRLIIKANQEVALDTMVNFNQPFSIRCSVINY